MTSSQNGSEIPLQETPLLERHFLRLSVKNWLRLTTLVALIAVVVVAFVVFDAEERLEDLLEWVDDNEAPGFFLFVLAYCLATVFFIPGSLLSLGAGFVFGIWLGAVAVWFGATLGQTFAFLAGRYLFREWVSTYAQRFKIWRGLEIASEEEGWKIVSLLRLAPIVPYSALNYSLGLTAVSFLEYFIASAVFIIPGIFLYVYLGSLADDIRELSSGDSPLNGTTTIAIAAVSGVVIIVTVVLTSRYAKRAIDKRIMMEEDIEMPAETRIPSQSSDNQPPNPNV